MSKRGYRRILTTPLGAFLLARDGGSAACATTPSPTRRCRGRLELERLVQQPRKWVTARSPRRFIAFIAGGGVGWLARGAATTPPHSRASRSMHSMPWKLYVVEVRHPVEVPGSERAHLQQWLTKRCGCRTSAPELTANGFEARRRQAAARPDRTGILPDV